MDLQLRIEAHALANAYKYGEARAGNVIPKIIGEFPHVKENMKAVSKQISTVVQAMNKLSKDEQLARLEQIAPDLLEKKQPKKRELPELPNVKGKVVTRLPPEPSKYNHLGHALTFLINDYYATKYKGKLVLRFEDANPEKVSKEFVDEMMDDIKNYLGINPNDIHYVSDDMEKLYEYAEQLLKKKAAYMCFCDRDTMSKKRRAGEECECRESNSREWKNFVDGKYMNGECVLRFKGEMKSKNTVLRDPVLFRAVKAEHFRQGKKYKVWPLYDFYSPIEEAICGVTHVIRSNEFDLRVELHEKVQELLSLPTPEIVHYGRFNITGTTTKGREIREMIETGEYIGWDDPRLVTLRALKRRGIRKEAYYELVKQLGLSPYQVNLDFSMLAALNRKLIEPTANRYSFVEDPVEITVQGAKEEDVILNLHPDKKDGRRVLHVKGKYLISKKDMEKKRIRLMGYLSIDENHKIVPRDKKDIPVNWLPADSTVPVEITMNDASVKRGVAELNIKDLKVDDVIQFERFGFCRLDSKEPYKFWYTHE